MTAPDKPALPEPAAWASDLSLPQPHTVTALVYRSAYECEIDPPGDERVKLYTADQMRIHGELCAAQSERGSEIATHGAGCWTWGARHYQCALLEVEHLQDELTAAKRDAARYRWLARHARSTAEHWGGRWSLVIDGPAPKCDDEEDALDEAVDAAMAKGGA